MAEQPSSQRTPAPWDVALSFPRQFTSEQLASSKPAEMSLVLVWQDGVFYNVSVFSHRFCHSLLIRIKLYSRGEDCTKPWAHVDGNYRNLTVCPGPTCHGAGTCYSSPFISVTYDSTVGISHKNLLILLLIIMLGWLFRLLAMSCLIIFTSVFRIWGKVSRP